jgi:CRISPR-associated protein Cas1
MAEQDGRNLWERVTSQDGLQFAWSKVLSNEGSAGGDGVSLRDFGKHAYENLTELRADLLAGTFRTGPFRRVSIPKKKPGYRILTIPSIRDRVLHTRIVQVLTPIFEPMFEDGSFAYRPNRGVQSAVARIETWRKHGFNFVIEADIVRYFDSVDHEILSDKVTDAIGPLDGSAPVIRLLKQLIEEQGQALGTPGRGIAQGSPLSPLMANLYLDALDEEIEDQGVKIVRFADDFVILCKSERKAEKVLKHCVQVLADHNLRMHDDGTRIVSFDKGFDFIGYLFLRTLALKKAGAPDRQKPSKPIKSAVSDEGVIELDNEGSRFDPGQRSLYVLDANHRLDIRNRSFSVQRDDGSELIAIPHRRISRIEIGPGVDYSHRPVELAIQSGVELAIIDGLGQTKGIVSPRRPKRAGVHLAQAQAVMDDEFRLRVAQKVVGARIRNQRTQLMRLNRGRGVAEVSDALKATQRTLRKLQSTESVGAVFGIEGAASALYWPALGLLLDRATAPLKRSRPAADPINATINYLTGILERDIRAAIHTSGLHQGFAFLHASRDWHDGLVFDLMEPFRAPLTEGIAVYLFNANRLKSEMFEEDFRKEIVISDDGRRAIVQGYETAVARRVNKADGPGKLAWRQMMLHQARGLVHAVKKRDVELFTPYLMEA